MFPILILPFPALSIKLTGLKHILSNPFKQVWLDSITYFGHYLLYFGLVFGMLSFWPAIAFILVHQILFGVYLGMIFAPNQGVVARIAGEPPGGDMGTIVVWDGSRRLVRSDAVLLLLRGLGGGWRLLAGLAVFCPVALRDFVYDQVARRRHRFAGPATCTRLSPHDLAE